MYLIDSIYSLSSLFFLAALLYSLVGFGGGSTYIALLAVSGVSYSYAPTLALICNIIVVLGGTFHFLRNRQVDLKLILPFIILSVPMAYIGGSIQIERSHFQIILGVSLLLASIKMLLYKNTTNINKQLIKKPPFYLALLIGAALGFVSGLVGIGGGIFLAPVLYLLNWGSNKTVPPTTSLFILINSIAGLVGQVQKNGSFYFINDYLLLIIAVFFGGQLGSWLCSKKLNARKVEVFTSLLLISVSIKILKNVLEVI